MSGSHPEHLLVSQPAKHPPDAEVSTPAEWLDRYRWLPFVLLATIPFLATLPLWIYHLSTDPIWFFSGIVKDVRSGVNATGLPFGDPNVGWTSQALGHLAASQWLHGKIPWWNAYSGIGLPLAGEMQPGAFFLPFVLLLLLSNGFVWLRIAMQLVAGFSTFALAREMRLGRLAAVLAGILFELNGTFAFTPGPDSVFCAAAFLPLLLLGIEQVSKRERQHTGTLWIALGIGFSLLAGFPEVAYIDGLLALLWCVCRFATLADRWRFALRVAWGGVLGILLTAPLLAGFWALLKQSSAFSTRQTGLWSIATTAIPSIFVPYIFGPFPAATADVGRFNVWGANNYAGLVLIFFAGVGLQARKPLWLRMMLVAWVAIAWAKTFGVKPVVAMMNHIPFIRQTAFYQYSSSSWILCLIILAAFGIEELHYRNPRLSLAVLLSLVALGVSVHIAWPWRHFWGSQPAEIAVMSRYFIFGLGWALAGLVAVIVLLVARPRGEQHRIGIAAILAINAAVFFSIPNLSAVRPGSVDRSAVQFLKSHLGLSRFYTLGPIQPNYSAYFQMASIDYDAFPVPASFSRHITDRLFPPLPKTEAAIFWPGAGWYDPGSGLNYLCKSLPQYEALGVKYVVAGSGTMDTLAPQAIVPTSGQDGEALALKPGERAQLTVPLPANPAGSNNVIRGFAIFVGTYTNTADGDVHVQVCADGACTDGSRPLSESADNSFFYIPLARPLTAPQGTPVNIIIRHTGGKRPVALWIWRNLPQQNQNLQGPDGKPIPDRAARVSFSYESGGGAPRVYHDSVVDIFQLPNAAPYYSIQSGGPCSLDSKDRDAVHAVCQAPALLVRRELYMPGWRASLQGRQLEAKPHEAIFQSFNLPRGDSRLTFTYRPPRAEPAVFISLFGAALLVADFAFWPRRRCFGAASKPPFARKATGVLRRWTIPSHKRGRNEFQSHRAASERNLRQME